MKNLCAAATLRLCLKSFSLSTVILLGVACQSEPTTAPISPTATLAATESRSDPPPSPTATGTPLVVSAGPTPVSPTFTPDPTPTPAPPSPTQGGTAILGLVGQPDSLNPITDNNRALAELTPLLFESLLRADPDTAALQPGLAQRWAYAAGGQQVVFHLPANLKWSNGDPLTAVDVAESLEATQHPALLKFSDISAPDDETLVLTFLNIDCAAVTTLALLPLLPAPEITATVPAGSGPFTIRTWSANKRTLSLSPNPYYRGPPPYLAGLAIRFLDKDEIEIAVSEGQFDVIGPIEATSASPLTLHNSPFTIHNYPAPQVIYIAINYDPHNDPPLAPEVRQALLLALDRETILTEALANKGQLMAASLLPDHWAANTMLSPPAYDPDAARALLREAGLRDTDGDGWLDRAGERLDLGIRLNGKNPLHQNLGWLVAGAYRDVGLFARAESVPFDSVVDDLFTHDFTLAIFSWPLQADPDQRVFWHSSENTEGLGLNFTSYNNPQMDTLLDEAVAVPGCQAQNRSEVYAEIQQILAEERPVDFLLTPNRHLLVANRLHGLQPGPFASLTWNATGWYVVEDE